MCDAAPGRWRSAAHQVDEMRVFVRALTLLVRDLTELATESEVLLAAVVALCVAARALL